MTTDTTLRTAPTAAVRCAVLPLDDRPDPTGDDLMEEVRGLWDDPVLREAVALASPVLAGRADSAVVDGDVPSRKNLRKLHRGLLKYALRISSRPTPFGLFAGVAPVRFGDEPLCLGPGDAHEVRARTGYDVLADLVTEAGRPETNPVVSVHASAYVAGDRVVIPVSTGTGEHNRTRDLRVGGPLAAVLDLASSPRPLGDLAAEVAARFPDAPREVVDGFLAELLDHGLLVSSHVPSPFEADPTRRLRSVAPEGLVESLADYRGSRRGEDGRRALGTVLGTVHREDAEIQRSLHVDLGLDCRGELPRSVADSARDAFHALTRVSTLPTTPAPLVEHANLFLEVFGDVDVPLLTALDPFRGIGYPAGYPSARRVAPPVPEPTPAPEQAELRTRLLDRAARSGTARVELTDDDLARLPDPANPPTSADVFLELGGTPSAPEVALAPSGTTFPAGRGSGRFAHDDPDITRHLEECARHDRDTHPDTLLCELDYVSSRAAVNNVARCPSVYDARLTVVRAAEPEDEGTVLTPSDLLLRVSDGLFHLRARDGRRVLVRRATMVTAETADDLVRFMDEVTTAGVTRPAWDWAGLEGRLAHLPEVRYRGVVLSPERRRVPLDVAEADDPMAAVRAWARDSGLPRHVLAGTMDNLLRLDVTDPVQADLLVKEARSGNWYVSVPPATVASGFARGDGGARHATEVVASVLDDRVDDRSAPPPSVPFDDGADDRRHLAPGNRWWSFEVPCEPDDQGDVLTGLVSSGSVAPGDFYFVRYHDGGDLLRIRFRSDRVDPGEVADALDGLRRRRVAGAAVIRSHVRELERYGGPEVLDRCEDLFRAESSLLVTHPHLCAAGDSAGADERRASLARCAAVLEAWWASTGVSPDVVEQVLDLAAEGYAHEFAKEDRALRKEVHSVAEAALADGDLRALRELLGPPAQAVAEAVRREVDPGRHVPLWQSLVHMLSNRLGLPRSREYQVVLVARARLRSRRLTEAAETTEAAGGDRR